MLINVGKYSSSMCIPKCKSTFVLFEFYEEAKIEIKKIKLIILLDSSAIVRSKIKRKVALTLITLEKIFVKEIFRLKEPG